MPTSVLPGPERPSRGSLGRPTQLHCRRVLPQVPGEVASEGIHYLRRVAGIGRAI